MHKPIEPASVFKSKAPTSLANLTEGTRQLHISGQTPVDSDGKNVGRGDIQTQVTQVLQNFTNIVEAGGASVQDVCRITVYLLRREDLPAVMEARSQVFQAPYPATTVAIVAGLANPDWLVEIEGLAVF